MNWFESIKNKILNEGYIILSEYYPKDDETIYSVIKHNSPTERTIFCEIARNIAMMLKREINATIEKQDNCVALNFIPIAVKPGCVRYTPKETEPENLLVGD